MKIRVVADFSLYMIHKYHSILHLVTSNQQRLSRLLYRIFVEGGLPIFISPTNQL